MKPSPFTALIIGALAIATFGVGHAGAVETLKQSCTIFSCPEVWQHPDFDARNRLAACQNNPNGVYLCFEEQGSVTSDKSGYVVSPNYVCWKGCMKGRLWTQANKAICTSKCKSVPR